jgi:bacterioferritin
MKGHAEILQRLNEILVGELTAINQYFLGAKLCRRQGYERLAQHLHGESIEEMKHAEKLIDRILFLEGLPNVQKLEKIRVGESIPEQLNADLELERRSVERLNAGVKLARERGDNGTAEILGCMVLGAEHHVDWLETQLSLIKQLGEAAYLAQQIRKQD